jgi:hypothetical protein
MRRRASILIACAFASGAIATEASSQRTGSRIGKTAGVGDGRDALRLIADCVVGKRPNLTAQWLDVSPGSTQEGKLLDANNALFSDCMTSDRLVLDGMELKFKRSMLRRPIAASAIRLRLRGKPTPPLPAVTAPWYESHALMVSAGSGVDSNALALQAFGHCVALARWDSSVALLKSQIDSREETAALAQIIPALGPCLPAKETIKVRRDMIRDILAEPVYHLLTAANGQGSTNAHS